MKNFGLIGIILLFWAAANVSAQTETPSTTPSPTPVPFQSLRYDEDYSSLQDKAKRREFPNKLKYIPLGKEDFYVSIGGEARLRYEYYDNVGFGTGTQDANGYLLQRYLFHADWHFGKKFRVFTQLQSALVGGRRGGARPTDKDELDLHQAFFDVKLGNEKRGVFTIRAGRQEVEFGSGRLVSASEGLNVRRSFDGVRLIYNRKAWEASALFGKLVAVNPGFFDDSTIGSQTYWSTYLARRLPRVRGGIAVYLLAADRKQSRFFQGTGREIRYSIGARVWRNFNGFDFNYELIGQWGSFGEATGGKPIRAWAISTDTGKTFEKLKFAPRLGFKTDFLSGDKNPRDGKLNTFNPFFPNTAYSGLIGLIGPLNVVDVAPSLRLSIHPKVSVTLDSTFYWRQNINDGLYGVNVNLQRVDNLSRERYIGNLSGVRAEWRINRHLTATAVYSRFWRGSFLRETPPGEDVNYFSTWLTYRF